MGDLKIPKLFDTKNTRERFCELDSFEYTSDREAIEQAHKGISEAIEDIADWQTIIYFTVSDADTDKVGMQVIFHNEESDIYIDYTLYVAKDNYNELYGTKFVYSKKAWGAIQEPEHVLVSINQ